MIFTLLGKVIAWLALIVGSLRVGMGFWIASIDDPVRYAFAVKRYLGSVSSSGEAIDRGMYTVLFGIALGVLTEISTSVRKRRDA